MWLFTALFLTNAWADNQGFILIYRLNVGGVVINVLDGLTLLGFLMAISPFSGRNRFVVDRSHPMLGWILVLLVVGGIGAAGVGILNGVGSRALIISVRNFVVLPLCFFMGHQALQRPKQTAWVMFVLMLGSFASALLAMRATGSVSEKLAWGASFNETRNISVGGDFGIMAAAVAGFAIVSRMKMGFLVLRLAMLGACAGALVLVPHRGFWVVAAATLGASALWLPKAPIRRRVTMAITFFGILVGTAAITATIYSSVSKRNYTDFIMTRLHSLMPAGRDDTQVKAWDSRIPGALRELELFISEPLFGQGFGYAERDEMTHPDLAYHHNTWTSFLAQSGVVGFAATVCMVGAMIVLGRRLIRDGMDRWTIFLGALSTTAGLFFLVNGLTTMSFNGQRQATTLALICGVVVRARSMQLTESRIWAGYIEPGELVPEEFSLPVEYEDARRPHAFA